MPFVGRKLRLKILEVNRKANRLILSEKVALYEERREKRDELFSSLQVGQKVTGTVRSIAPFGVFIDLGGIDGLVHKSELSWNKVNNPESGYKVGDEVEAEVIDINHERGRISLSIRRLQPDPWHSTVADFNVGDVIDGTVTKLVNFGAFVRVRDGLEGLIHISELSHQRVAHPGDVVHEGQTLKLKIISLDSERHRLGLSLKQAEEPRPPGSGARQRSAERWRRGPLVVRPAWRASAAARARLVGAGRRPGARGRHRQHPRRGVRPGPRTSSRRRKVARAATTSRAGRRLEPRARGRVCRRAPETPPRPSRRQPRSRRPPRPPPSPRQRPSPRLSPSRRSPPRSRRPIVADAPEAPVAEAVPAPADSRRSSRQQSRMPPPRSRRRQRRSRRRPQRSPSREPVGETAARSRSRPKPSPPSPSRPLDRRGDFSVG